MCVEGWECGIGGLSHLASQGTNKASFAERWIRKSKGFVLSNGKFLKIEGKGSILLEKEQNQTGRTEQKHTKDNMRHTEM